MSAEHAPVRRVLHLLCRALQSNTDTKGIVLFPHEAVLLRDLLRRFETPPVTADANGGEIVLEVKQLADLLINGKDSASSTKNS